MVVVERNLGIVLVEEEDISGKGESLEAFVAAGRKNLSSMKGDIERGKRENTRKKMKGSEKQVHGLLLLFCV